MNEHGISCTDRATCQHISGSPPAPAHLLARLPFLLDRLRALEQQFFSLDFCDPAGLAAAQCRLLFLRLQVGVPVPDGQLREARLRLEDFLRDQPEGVRHA